MMLETFAPRTCLACCATCHEWTWKRGIGAYCPVLKQSIEGHDLTACGCAAWVCEPRESYAIQTYDELVKEGAK